MKDKIFGVLQRVGRSFMLPIAILPVAGLLLGFGSSFTNETTIATYGLQKILGDGTILHALLIIMNKVGSAVFDNLPLIFAVGVAIGMAKKEKEVAALSALIAYFVMNVAINGMLVVNGKITADGQIAKSVLDAGGNVTGVEPQFFMDEGFQYNGLTELIVTKDMAERKTKMIQLGDAFIAFPGGTGTLEEIAEVMSKVSLKQLDAPCILYNLNGYYDDLKALLGHMIEKGLSSPERQEGIYFAEDLAQIQTILEKK